MKNKFDSLSNEYETNSKRNGTEAIIDLILQLPRKSQEIILWYINMLCHESISKPKEKYALSDLVDLLKTANDCQSPIEKIFLTAFLIARKHYGYSFLILKGQKQIFCEKKFYIADFVFDTDNLPEEYTAAHNFKFVIECDGHDFHKLTKEQVKHDNERDMDLKIAGYDVLHFSGTQLYQNPWKCAEETLNYIVSKVGKVSKK